jgi:hypothetical protein
MCAFLVVALITFVILRSSERYQHCIEEGQQKAQQISPQNQTANVIVTFVIGKRCLGDYVQAYSPGISALFTLILAASTVGLWFVTWAGIIGRREETRMLTGNGELLDGCRHEDGVFKRQPRRARTVRRLAQKLARRKLMRPVAYTQ